MECKYWIAVDDHKSTQRMYVTHAVNKEICKPYLSSQRLDSYETFEEAYTALVRAMESFSTNCRWRIIWGPRSK